MTIPSHTKRLEHHPTAEAIRDRTAGISKPPTLRAWALCIVLAGTVWSPTLEYLSTKFGSGTQASDTGVFKGRVLRILVGVSPGGGFDTYARIMAAHLGRHIPGAPTVIVENMTGAGGLIEANYLAQRARPDGLTLGLLGSSSVMAQLLEEDGVRFDVRKFEFVGAPAPEIPVCVFSKASGVTSIKQWMTSKVPPRFGLTGPGSNTYIFTLTIAAALGLPVQPIVGFTGTSQIRLAMQGGEISAACLGWDSVSSSWVPREDFVVVLQAAPTPAADLAGIPSAINLAKTAEGRELIERLLHVLCIIGRYYALPPGTPNDRVQVLRTAFMQTMRDPAFLADAAKARLPVEPVSGDEVKRNVVSLLTLPSPLALRVRQALARKG